MEIHNFNNGVFVKNIDAIGTDLNSFYPKNIGRVSLSTEAAFTILDTFLYQAKVTFVRGEVTIITDNGVPVPVPGTDALLYDLLCSYFYQAVIFSPVNNFAPVNNNTFSPTIFLNPSPSLAVNNVVGPAIIPAAGDNGKYFVVDPPAAPKTFTISSGLPIGWYCWVIKSFVGNTVTINGAGGMAVVGPDLILNNQWSVAKIVVIGLNIAHIQNVGG